jgi:hypothetical protein
VSEPRERLRQANAAAEEAVAISRRALSDASKARQRLDEAKAGLEVFASLDADITASTVEQLKRDEGFAFTGNVPKEMELPGHLRDRSRAYTAAKERVLRLEAAVAMLDQDAIAAQAEAARCAKAAEIAAAAVLSGIADDLATELSRLEWQTSVMRQRLLSMASVWVDQRPLAMSAVAVDLIRTPPQPLGVDPAETGRWQTYLASLLVDAAAPVPQPQLPDRPRAPQGLKMQPSIPWTEHRAQLEQKHNARVHAAARVQADEQAAALAVHRAAVAKVREAGRKSIAS